MRVGSWVQGGGHTFKLKMAMTLFLKYLTGNKFALIHFSMIRMCNKIKIKDSLWSVIMAEDSKFVLVFFSFTKIPLVVGFIAKTCS